MARAALWLGLVVVCGNGVVAADADLVVNVWPGDPPGPKVDLPEEGDTTGPDGRTVAGRRVIRIGNVTTPTLSVYRPSADLDTGTAVVVCPGGGHRILAWDLEGTEVAEWLNTIGVTGIVLKYRVPARDPNKKWEAAVQDAQRAVSLVRSKSDDWGIDPERIGVLGFSAGGQTAGLTAVFAGDRKYEASDDVDSVSCRPDFAVLVYPAYFASEDRTELRDELQVTDKTPPMFLAHAFDDPVPVESSLLLMMALKRAKVPSELHVYPTGGHGYGLRPTDEPVTTWPARCETWLRGRHLLERAAHDE